MRLTLLGLVLLFGVAAAAPLPKDLRWIDNYNGLRSLTGPKDAKGQNDYDVTGEPTEVFQVLKDKLISQGWKARERYGFPKTKGQGLQQITYLRYCDFTRNQQRMGLQVYLMSGGRRMLTVFWQNWQESSPSPAPQP